MIAPLTVDSLRIDPQRLAADPALSVFVAANAGSGKTTTLVNRVARLLLTGVEPGAILCVTYTKAAAAEMQGRLFDQLGKWALMGDPELRRTLFDLDGRDPERIADTTLAAARRLFARALETPGGLKIQTLHALCEALLRRFPLEAGVSPRFEVLEDARARALSRQAREDLADAVLADPEGPVARAFNTLVATLDHARFESLLQQLEDRRGELLAWLDAIDEGTAPTPFDLTRADPARNEAALEADFLAGIDPGAWRSCAAALAGGSSRDQGLAAAMRAVESIRSHTAMQAVFCTGQGEPLAESQFGTKAIPEAVRTRLLGWQAAWINTRKAMAAWRAADLTQKVLALARVHAGYYEAAKARAGALDFADLIHRTVELLTRRTTSAWVLYKLDGGLRHVLVDEAQDTAPEQWDIIRALTDDFFTGPDDPRTLFAVGDEKQSIYAFQGARPERLMQEGRAYQDRVEASGQRFAFAPLATSWRSTAQVLAFVDQLFGADPARSRALSPDTGDRPHHRPARRDPGCVELWPIYQEPATVERDSWLDPVDAEGKGSARQRLARDIAREIVRQVRDGVAVQDPRDRKLRPCGYGDFLILVRKRDALFEEIIRALKREGAPVAGADRLNLGEHIAFRDLLALMRFALYPHDDLSLAEILRGPFCDVDEDSLYALAGADQARPSLWRALRDRARERAEWGAALTLLLAARAAANGGPFAFVTTLLERVDAGGRTGRARLLARLGAEAAEVIEETLSQCLRLEREGVTDLEGALGRLETTEIEVKRELEGPRGEVRIMTVHGAKGLEAPVVILPDTTGRSGGAAPLMVPAVADDGETEVGWLVCLESKTGECEALKRARARREQRVEAESLRLLYVALTRARDRLILAGRRPATRGPPDKSWWTALCQTLETLETTPGDGPEGALRFGPAPIRLAPEAAQPAAAAANLPTWAVTPLAPERAARVLAPSRLAPLRGQAAPSPLVAAGGGWGAGALGRFGRGALIHRLLERLPDLPPAAWRSGAAALLTRAPGVSPEAAAEITAAALGVLEDPRFAGVFGPGSRAEAALAGRVPGLPAAIDGRIDRLVITPDRVLIVDFKTRRPAPDRVEDVEPAYVLQLALYRAVLTGLYPGRTVEAALVWTDGPSLMPVPAPLMDAAIADLG
ncbi:MAG: double-strand break repair helicase AddA [Brevundimonas sp.]|jgi:ATP-dependent helicase/nuclease subunit A|uniref:double-strand break repair helicase AddA n=3 Tax=Brevundimonas sp. TaxID=1871086 RepID=UPI0039188F60